MNKFLDPKIKILRVMITDPFTNCSKILIGKLLDGSVFGDDYMVTIQLLICEDLSANKAEVLKVSIENCAFCCMQSIDIVPLRGEGFENPTDIPDFIVFTSISPNSNTFKCFCKYDALKDVDIMSDLRTIAFNLDYIVGLGKKLTDKPTIVADGLVCLQVLNMLCPNFPSELMYCPTPLNVVAKSILADYLKVNPNNVNDLRIWAANDANFHIEVERPVVLNKRSPGIRISPELEEREFFRLRKLDYTTFNDTWLKKDLKEETKHLAERNPYGEAAKARSLAETLKTIWMSRMGENEEKTEIYCNLGVISEAGRGCSGDTISRGTPMVLPVVLFDGRWKENEKYMNIEYVQCERINLIEKARRNFELVKLGELHFINSDSESNAPKYDINIDAEVKDAADAGIDGENKAGEKAGKRKGRRKYGRGRYGRGKHGIELFGEGEEVLFEGEYDMLGEGDKFASTQDHLSTTGSTAWQCTCEPSICRHRTLNVSEVNEVKNSLIEMRYPITEESRSLDQVKSSLIETRNPRPEESPSINEEKDNSSEGHNTVPEESQSVDEKKSSINETPNQLTEESPLVDGDKSDMVETRNPEPEKTPSADEEKSIITETRNPEPEKSPSIEQNDTNAA